MRKAEITYDNDGEETKAWRERFVALLSKGIYEYLKRTGQLRRSPALQQKAQQVLEETKRLANGANGECT